MSRPYKVIVLSDLQVPYHDTKAIRLLERYMADERWDEWLQLGDFMDFDQISRFTKDSPERLSRSLSDDYVIGNKLLDSHQRIVRKKNPDAKFTILSGNHDLRAEKFAEHNPQLKGIVEVEHGLRLKERGIKFVRCYPDGEIYKIGKASFTHGLYTNQNHAKKHSEMFNRHVFYGHTHQLQMHSKASFGSKRTIIGQSLGTLSRHDLDYIGKNPKAWSTSFCVFYFQKNGDFNYYPVYIHDWGFVAPNGKTYR